MWQLMEQTRWEQAQICRSTGIPMCEQKLLLGTVELSTDETLDMCLTSEQSDVSVTLVRVRIRGSSVFCGKLAEQAERYDEMVRS